jgi:hypothetical protein
MPRIEFFMVPTYSILANGACSSHLLLELAIFLLGLLSHSSVCLLHDLVTFLVAVLNFQSREKQDGLEEQVGEW